MPPLETKDPGQIILGLKDNGVSTELITDRRKEIAEYNPKFSVTQATWNELNSDAFWRKHDADVILAYTWLNEALIPLLERIKSNGKKVLVKVDSDGQLGYPMIPATLRVPFSEDRTVRSLAGRLWWELPSNYLQAHRAQKVAMGRIRQIEVADGVIIESPDALANLNYYLTAWARPDLIKKTYFVPDPVAPDFVDAKIGKKENIVVSYGRWQAFQQKNTAGMAETLTRFLEVKHDYKSFIFGGGKDIIDKLTQNLPQDIAERLAFLGYVERSRINQILSSAKIFFMPSRWESFGIAAAESLCMGCSVTVTPVESLRYLAMQGFSGTVSSDFSKNALLAAMIEDATKWERGYYESEKIAEFWRAVLDRKSVAKKIMNIAQNL